MRIAYFSPLPPERSGIADYSALLIPALRERIDVHIVRRGARRVPRGVDLAVYHIGNNPEAHGWIAEALRLQPGLVVLHEFVLHHLVAGLTLGRGDRSGYLDAMEQEGGIVGRSLGHAVIDGLLPPLWEVRPQDFPLASAVIARARGLVVHSRYVEERARAVGYPGPIWRIPHPVWAPPPVAPDPTVARTDSLVVGCIGNLNASKRIPQVLAAFAALRERLADVRLVLAGAVARDVELEYRLARHGLRRDEDVLVLGHVEDSRLWPLFAACDICVNLRWPTMGETSGSALRALALGRPLVVSDVGWFSELPDAVVAKVPVDEHEADVLARVLGLLADDARLREQMGSTARDYVQREHDLDRVADAYLGAVEEAAGFEAVQEQLLRELAHAAREVGIEGWDPQLAELAGRVREVGLGD